MTPTQEQRAMMAADLADRAAKAIRGGEASVGVWLAGWIQEVLTSDDPAVPYMSGLEAAGLSPADIDAAVASIARGEHPADSLPGMVAAIRDRASVPGHPCPRGETEWNIYGRMVCAIDVLDLLGCKVTS